MLLGALCILAGCGGTAATGPTATTLATPPARATATGAAVATFAATPSGGVPPATATRAGSGTATAPRAARTPAITFGATSLDPAWGVLHPEVLDIAVQGDTLTLTLKARALWAGNQQGVLVYRTVTGDFKVSATVRARQAGDPTKPPAGPVRLGGLMAHNPASGINGAPENYVHIVVGFAPNALAVETKTTLDNDTKFESPAWESGDAELRICRVGATFSLYKRPVGAAGWQLAATHARPDLPPTLQVGPNIYSAVAPPDLRVTFAGVRFETVTGQAGCDQD